MFTQRDDSIPLFFVRILTGMYGYVRSHCADGTLFLPILIPVIPPYQSVLIRRFLHGDFSAQTVLLFLLLLFFCIFMQNSK